jgi:hypothetical protein
MASCYIGRWLHGNIETNCHRVKIISVDLGIRATGRFSRYAARSDPELSSGGGAMDGRESRETLAPIPSPSGVLQRCAPAQVKSWQR